MYLSSEVTVPADLNEQYPNIFDGWSDSVSDILTETYGFTVRGGTGEGHLWFDAYAIATDDGHLFLNEEWWIASSVMAGPISLVPEYHGIFSGPQYCYGLMCGTIPFTYGEPQQLTITLSTMAGYRWRRDPPPGEFCMFENCDAAYAGIAFTAESYIQFAGIWQQDPATSEWIQNQNAVIEFTSVPEPGVLVPMLMATGAMLLWRRRRTP